MSHLRWAACTLALLLTTQVAGLRLLIVSGDSMAPSIRDGDLVVTTRRWRDGGVGDVVLVQRAGDGQLLLHRVIEQGAGWRRTKGDASLSPDTERFTDAATLGVLAAVIPTSLITVLPVAQVAAQFTAGRQVTAHVDSASGARAEISGPTLQGTDPLGQLLAGGRATWSLMLTPCPTGLAGECAGATNTLRLDPDRFVPVASGGIARSLRLTGSCRTGGGPSWSVTADLFTAAWSLTNPATGRLVSMPSGAVAQECQIQVTLLGELSAANQTLHLPLRWGPE